VETAALAYERIEARLVGDRIIFDGAIGKSIGREQESE
jgi:hypothetical protein